MISVFNELFQGQLLCLDSCPDMGYVFAMGGEKTFKVWDVREVKDGKWDDFGIKKKKTGLF